MKYMLDTNICIYLINKKPTDVIEKFKSINYDDVCISSITYSELCYGVMKSKYVERNRIALYMFLSGIKVVDYDSLCSENYGKIKAYLEENGKPIGPMDTLIASHCLTLGLTLVTNNVKEFNRIPKLKIENWASQ